MATEKKQVKTKVYVVVRELADSEKCPPQAKLIIDTIKAAGGKMSREDLLTQLKRPAEQGGLKTNQTAERILGFYRPKLVDDLGILKEETVTTEIEVEVPDKPAKAPKAEGASATGGGESKEKGKKGPQKTA